MIKFYLLGFFLILRISTEVVNNVIHYNPLNNSLFSLNFYNQVFKHKNDFSLILKLSVLSVPSFTMISDICQSGKNGYLPVDIYSVREFSKRIRH